MLLLRHCKDALCRNSATAVIESPSFNQHAAVATNTRGFASVVYEQRISSDAYEVRIVDCRDADCTSSDRAVLDVSIPFDVYGVAIQKGTDERSLIAYTTAGGILKVLHCEADPCVLATGSVLRTDVGSAITLASGEKHALIASVTNGFAKVTHCENPACTAAHEGASFELPPSSSSSRITLGTTKERFGVLIVAEQQSSAEGQNPQLKSASPV